MGKLNMSIDFILVINNTNSLNMLKEVTNQGFKD